MKQLWICLAVVGFIVAGNNVLAQNESMAKEKDKMEKKMGGALPYKADYSADFKIGNSSYSKMILDIWKDWDDNQLDRHSYFADTIVGMFADGSVSKGKEAFIADGKKYRNTQTSVKSTIHAFVPLLSTERNENVVCIWGTEERTMTDGKKETGDLHEVWWFNKDGKITMLRQWAAKFKEM